MRTPAEYAEEPQEAQEAQEAIVLYCGRFVQLLRWASIGRMVRLGIAEAERLPDLAAGLYDVVFGSTADQLASHLVTTWKLATDEAEVVANEVIGLAIHPTLPRLLFGVDVIVEERPEESTLAADVDLDRIRRIVRAVIPTRTT